MPGRPWPSRSPPSGRRTARSGVFVRVNPLDTRLTGADLEAVVVPGLTGVFAPKISTATDVLRYDALLDHFEERNGVGGLEYIVPVEMIGAIQNAREIALSSPRVGAMIGPTAEHADIARAVGYQWTPEGEETLYLRSRILLACREAGIHPLTGLWERLEDLAGLKAFAAKGRQLGFRGMIAIHPSHVATVNEAFTASAEDIEFHEGLRRRLRPGRRGRTRRGALPRRAHRQGARRHRPRVARARPCDPRRRRVRPPGTGRRARDRRTRRGTLTMRGLYFEEFEVGRVYKHPFTRTVTESDNVLFTSLTMNPQPLHLDHEFAKHTIHGRPLFNSLFTLALVGGFHVLELTFGTTLGNLGYDSVKFPNPVFHGDTLRGETTILDKRESKSRTDSGIVWFEHRGYNQHDQLIMVCTRVGLMARSPEHGGSNPAIVGDQTPTESQEQRA